MNWKQIHDTGLRGAFCTIWVFSGLVGAMDWLVALTADYGSPEKLFYTRQGIVASIVFVVAALSHAQLLSKIEEKKDV